MQNKHRNTAIIVLFSVLVLAVGFPANGEVESPKKQMKKGVSAEDVLCKTGLELIIRTNGLAACVKPETAERMKKAGMISEVIEFTDLAKEIETVPASKKEIETVPASNMSIVNFYITDPDLNLAHNGIEVVSTTGLFEFTINGVPISGPENMIENGPKHRTVLREVRIACNY